MFAVFELKKAGTAFDARKASTALVTTGVYQFSRNPTYLSMTILFVGISLLLNSMMCLFSVAVATFITQVCVIKYEEQYLMGKYGSEYSQYKINVRPWI